MNYSKYVSKKLPNSYIAGWSWFYGRTEAASVAQSAKQGEFGLTARPIYLQTVFLNTGLQMASLSYDSDHCSI
jgi:hypothetical protein